MHKDKVFKTGSVLKNILTAALFLAAAVCRADPGSGTEEITVAASAPRARPRAVESAEFSASKPFAIEPFLGVGESFESYTGYTPYMKAGGNLRYSLDKNLAVGAGIGLSFYDQTYLIEGNSPAFVNSNSPVLAAAVPETKVDLNLKAIYSLRGVAPDLDVNFAGGYRGIYLQNSLTPMNIHAVSGWVDGSYRIPNDMKLKGAYNLALDPFGYSNTVSLLGSPNVCMGYSLGVFYPAMPDVKVEFGYEGEVLFFQFIDRFYNGLYLKMLL